MSPHHNPLPSALRLLNARDNHDAIVSLVSECAGTLLKRMNCVWSAALIRIDHELAPFAFYGRPPHYELWVDAASLIVVQGDGAIALNNKLNRQPSNEREGSTFVIVPVRVEQTLKGIIALGPKRDGNAYTASDLDMMEAQVKTVVNAEVSRYTVPRAARQHWSH